MEKKILLIIIISIFLVFYICLSLSKGFYDYYSADIDLFRIPLIRPYELNAVDVLEGEGWCVPTQDSDTEFQFGLLFPNRPGVDSVTIKNNLILLYSSGENFLGISGVVPVWFIFDAEKKKGEYFLSEQEFYNYLKKNYHISKINFYDSVALFQEFRNSYKLPPEWDSLVLADKKAWWKRFYY